MGHFTNLVIDGWCGLLVSLFLLRAGIEAAKDTIAPLLGQKPDEELVKKIYSIVMAHPEVGGVHDLVVHDYGPGRLMITLHAEVNSEENILYIHDVIDNIEVELKDSLNCAATIHMDPVSVNDEKINSLKSMIYERMVALFGEEVNIHDFRVVEGPTHTNVIFDIMVPFDFKYTDGKIMEMISEDVSKIEGTEYRSVVTVDHAYA